MLEDKLQRQFHGTCALIQVQMMRAAKCRDIEKCYAKLVAAGKITTDDVEFIEKCLELDKITQQGDAALKLDESAHQRNAALKLDESAHQRNAALKLDESAHQPDAALDPDKTTHQETDTLNAQQDTSNFDPQTIKDYITRLHSIVASKLNVADSA